MDRHSTWQANHVRLTEGVVAQVASLLLRHKDWFLPLFQLEKDIRTSEYSYNELNSVTMRYIQDSTDN